VTAAPFDRAAVVLGAGALVGALFALTTGGPEPVNLIHVRRVGLLVLIVLGALAVVGGLLRRVLLVIAAGTGLVLAAVLQLLQVGRSPNWLGGDGSTLALMGGLGLGLLAVGLTNRLTARPLREDS